MTILAPNRTPVHFDAAADQIALADTQAHARFRAHRDAEVRRLADHTPPALRERDQWALWNYERDDDGRWTKVPRRALDPERRASSTDSGTWASFHSAMSRFEAGCGDGVLFALDDRDPFAVIDFDDCRDPRGGSLTPYVAEVVACLASYTEISPSGRGLHIWLRGELPAGGRVRREVPIEVYDAGRFVSVTASGHAGCGTLDIHSRPDGFAGLLAEHWPDEPWRIDGGSDTIHAPAPRPRITPLMADVDVLTLAATARNSAKFLALWRGESTDHPSGSEADLALINCLLFWTQEEAQLDRLFRRSGRARPKWANRQDYRERTFDRAFAGRTAADFYDPRRRVQGRR